MKKISFLFVLLFPMLLLSTDTYRIGGIEKSTAKATVKVGDMDGDGRADFLIVTRGFVDNKPRPLKVRGYSFSKELLFTINMGETEIPLRTAWTLWNLTGDKKEEVIGVMKFRGGTGYSLCVFSVDAKLPGGYRLLAKAPVPSSNYPWEPQSTRYKTITVAYLDGKRPYILYGSGHQRDQHRFVQAYRFQKRKGVLKKIWEFYEPPYTGLASSHQFAVADIDRDNKDEAFLGVYLFDLRGRAPGYWGGHEWSHVDGVHIANIRPDIPGQEVFFYVEERPGGVFLTDSRGKLLRREIRACKKTKHAHSGWVGDVLAMIPGMEMWAIYKGTGMVCPTIFYAKGGKYPRPIDLRYGVLDWDGKGTLEFIYRRHVAHFVGSKPKKVSPELTIRPGSVYFQDIWGDGREEIINFTQEPGGLAMYVRTNSAAARRVPRRRSNRQYLQAHRWSGH
jgi:hypothetical protein